MNHWIPERQAREYIPSALLSVRLQASYVAAFVLFGVGLMALYLCARARACGRPTEASQRATRRTIQRGARLFFSALRALSLARLSISPEISTPLNSRPRVVVANHPSMLDALLLLSMNPNGVCVMKPSLLRVPLIGGFARLAGYIPHGATPELLNRARVVLAEGASIIIFPEGTRSPRGGLGRLHRGAARIALEAEVPLDIISLRMRPVVLGRDTPWWRAPTMPVHYQAIRAEPPRFEPVPRNQSPEKLRAVAIKQTKQLEDHLKHSLSCEKLFDPDGDSHDHKRSTRARSKRVHHIDLET